MDATGAENHCTILVIEPSPIESNMLWVSTDDGRVHITHNGTMVFSSSCIHGITTTEDILIKHAEDALNEATNKTNAFYKESWRTYQSEMEKLQLNPFKPVKMF